MTTQGIQKILHGIMRYRTDWQRNMLQVSIDQSEASIHCIDQSEVSIAMINAIAAFQTSERQPRPHCSIRDVCGQQNVAIKVHPDQCGRHVHHQERWQHGASQVSLRSRRQWLTTSGYIFQFSSELQLGGHGASSV